MEAQAQPNVNALSTLLQLEGMARDAQSVKELHFLAVNETRRLIAYRQAFLVKAGPSEGAPCRVEAASSVSLIDRNAPLIRWIERAVHAVRPKATDDAPLRISEADCPEELRADWKEFSLPYVLWCPLRLPDETFMGGIWLAREHYWEDGDLPLAQRLAKTFAHAWNALLGKKKVTRRMGIPQALAWTVLVVGVAAMFLPVRFSTLAPVKVIAEDPTVVSAPMDGVIADIAVPPNTLVSEGQIILTYEDTNLRNQYEVADKNLTVALAEYHQASQGSFLDAQSKARVPLLKAEAELRQAERDYAKELLDQVEVKALGSGLLLYTDESDWTGRPVVVGERIMEIADPERIELRIDLPVDDAIVLSEGADVRVFLDARPFHAVPATLTHASYHAEALPGDVLAYRVTAQLNDPQPDIRIGWQGTAKIYGEDVSLFFLLFRRPISATRQFLGL